MKEPISTYTNVAYAVAGVMIWHVWITPVMIMLAVTSAGYHWTKSHEWRMADVDSMLLVLSVFLLHIWGVPHVFSLFVAAILILTKPNRTAIVLAWFALICAGVYIAGGAFWFVIPFAIGGACNIPFLWLSWNRRLTDAIHGIWHIATAIGLYMLTL